MIEPASRRLFLVALALQGAVLLVSAPLYIVAGLSIPLSSLGRQLIYPAFFGLVALLTARDRNGVPQALTALAVLSMAFVTIGPTQYLAAAWGRPLIDDQLLAADAALGINQAALVAWTNAHPQIRHALVLSYVSLLPQLILPVVVLGFTDRRELWRYIYQFECVAIVTIILFGLWPSGVIGEHGIPETISQRPAMTQIIGLRDGTMTTIRFEEGVGIISFPSFHAAAALVVTWALRRTWCFWPIVALNAALLASTVLLGIHYAIDVPGAVVVCAGSIAMGRGLRPWLEGSVHTG